MTYWVSEIGQNFCGDMDCAKQMIWQAHAHGADAAKFQLYDHRKLYGYRMPDVSLSFYKAEQLWDFGEAIGIEVFFSVFDVERVRWCETMGVKRYKVAHSQKDNRSLIQAIEDTQKPYIVSVDIDGDCAWSAYRPTRLFCVPEYPAENVQLPEKFDLLDGFSDHTIGLETAKEAIRRGARMIEKHFCLDHLTGVDARWSMTAEELKEVKVWEQSVSLRSGGIQPACPARR